MIIIIWEGWNEAFDNDLLTVMWDCIDSGNDCIDDYLDRWSGLMMMTIQKDCRT